MYMPYSYARTCSSARVVWVVKLWKNIRLCVRGITRCGIAVVSILIIMRYEDSGQWEPWRVAEVFAKFGFESY